MDKIKKAKWTIFFIPAVINFAVAAVIHVVDSPPNWVEWAMKITLLLTGAWLISIVKALYNPEKAKEQAALNEALKFAQQLKKEGLLKDIAKE